jgi:hypothetical protein
MALRSEDAATLTALYDQVQAARDEAALEWGEDRLLFLVGTEWREKLQRQKAIWSTALQSAWSADTLTGAMMDDVRLRAAGMVKAWTKLGEVASEAGHRPLAVDVWEVTLSDGMVAAFVRTADEAEKVTADGRYLVVYTAEEVGSLISTLPDALQLAKTAFPGSKIQPPRHVQPDWYKSGGDPIPF